VNDFTIAVDLNRRRIYARGSGRRIYHWLSSRFDLWDFLPLPNPVLWIAEELVASGGWTLDWKPE
jgi:hypothetical protein